jgi:Uma2 family endonuclease
LHEDVKKVAARLLEIYAVLVRIKLQGYGSMTMDREDLEKGLEPDECYYVQSFDRLPRGRRLDLSIDPPPDLAIEVDISPPNIARQPIYAALNVPEVWLYDGRSFRVLRRSPDGRYAESRHSACFPSLPIDEFNRFVRIGLESNQPAALEALMDWLRETQQQVRPL